MAADYFSDDTIVAIATSLAGDGGVGIIRLSGPRAFEAAAQVCKGLKRREPRYLQRIEIVKPESSEILDDGLAVCFEKGHSFTGEEVVELQLHGGRFLLQSILQLLIEARKCRLALPGEFSFRAVRNGKLSLAGAAAIGQLVGAKSMFEVQAARRSLGQARLKDFDELADSLRTLIAQMELSIDFIDQDVEVISAADVAREVRSLDDRLERMLVQMQTAQRIARGLTVALVGAPNVGKSTLFNALLTEERAIVSPEAGTTRDVITEEIRLDPYFLRLADTAGVRETAGAVEQEGIARARGVASEADLVLFVVDASSDDSRVQIDAGLDTFGPDAILVLNKADLIDEGALDSLADEWAGRFSGGIVGMSAMGNQGIEKLLGVMRRVLDSKFGLGLQIFLPTQFQLQMLFDCRQSLAGVADLVDSTALTHPELISTALRSAVKALSDLVGETTPDTVLTKIFSEFCIGK